LLFQLKPTIFLTSIADKCKKRANEKINTNLIKARKFIKMAKVGSKMHEKSYDWVKIRAFMIIRIIQTQAY